jgi:hypothetical protein
MSSSLRSVGSVPTKGSLHVLRWGSSTNSKYKSGKTSWVIESPWRKQTFLHFMKTKYLWGLATPMEAQMLLDEPGSLRDTLFLQSLLAKEENRVPLSILWPRIGILDQLGYKSFINFKVFDDLERRFVFRVTEYDHRLRPPKKYSGYVRSPSGVGSKRGLPRREPVPAISVEEYALESDFLGFLTVGSFMGTTQFSLQCPDDWTQLGPKRSRSKVNV